MKHQFNRTSESGVAIVSAGLMLGHAPLQAPDRRADVVRSVGTTENVQMGAHGSAIRKLVRPCMSPKALMSDHWGRPGGRCVPRTSVTVILFEERPPALNVEAEEYPRAHQEPVYKAGRRWCRVGGPDGMVKQTRPLCLVTRSSVSMLRPANWW